MQLFSRAATQWSDPVKESATRWHLKAILSPVVDWRETGHCQHCTCEGLKCRWGELRDSQSVWSEYTGFAEKRKGEGGNKKLQQPSPEDIADPNFGSELHLQNKLSYSQKTSAASCEKLELGLELKYSDSKLFLLLERDMV